jgi:hypothetical protein
MAIGGFFKYSALATLSLATVLMYNPTRTFADPACDKHCGSGSLATDPVWRDCSSGDCLVAECTAHIGGCGYDDNYNDWCVPVGSIIPAGTLCS